jgi:hypothetical protein
VFLRGPADAIDIGCLSGDVVRNRRCAGIARRDQEVRESARLAKLPGDRVLAGAGTDDEDVHAGKREDLRAGSSMDKKNIQGARRCSPYLSFMPAINERLKRIGQLAG